MTRRKFDPALETWIANEYAEVLAGADRVGCFGDPLGTPTPKDRARARLAGASPELLRAVEAVLPILRDLCPPELWTNEAARALVLCRDAAAKARGR